MLRKLISLVAAVAAVLAVAGPAGAGISGSVGSHTLGIVNCNAYDRTITIYSPRVYAVNSRYGANNDYQHVSATFYVYHWVGAWALVGSDGPWASYGANGTPAGDSSNAALGTLVRTLQMSGGGTFLVMTYLRWFDFPTTSFWAPTHNTVTGTDWAEAGRCTI